MIYGSVARGEERAASDIDLLVVADELTLNDEFRRRRQKRNPFLEKVLKGTHIMLFGDLNGTTATR